MDEITAEMLESFAAMNGLKIMEHRDAKDWAEKINKNNGLCPCGKECPCDDCTCKFYEKDTEMREIKNVELAGAVDAIEEAKTMILGMTDNPDEAAEAAIKAAKLIEEDAEKHTCGKCATYMEGLGRALTFLGEECKKDQMSCVIVRDQTVQRMDDMQVVFRGVDKDTSTEEETPDATQETAENLDSPLIIDLKNEGFSEYHTCVGETFNKDLEDLPRGDRMCVASKMCSKREPSKEEAIKECMEANRK